MTLPTPGVTPANWGAQLNSHIIPEWAGMFGVPTGGYLRVPSTATSQSGTAATTTALLYAIPFTLLSPVSVTKLAAALWANGTAGAVTRLGLYNANAAGYPTSLIVDAGTFSATSGATSLVAITLGAPQALSAGSYFAAIVTQGAPATPQKYITAITGILAPLMPGMTADKGWAAWTTAGVTGALPDPFTGGGTAVDTTAGGTPCVYIGA